MEGSENQTGEPQMLEFPTEPNCDFMLGQIITDAKQITSAIKVLVTNFKIVVNFSCCHFDIVTAIKL